MKLEELRKKMKIAIQELRKNIATDIKYKTNESYISDFDLDFSSEILRQKVNNNYNNFLKTMDEETAMEKIIEYRQNIVLKIKEILFKYGITQYNDIENDYISDYIGSHNSSITLNGYCL